MEEFDDYQKTDIECMARRLYENSPLTLDLDNEYEHIIKDRIRKQLKSCYAQAVAFYRYEHKF